MARASAISTLLRVHAASRWAPDCGSGSTFTGVRLRRRSRSLASAAPLALAHDDVCVPGRELRSPRRRSSQEGRSGTGPVCTALDTEERTSGKERVWLQEPRTPAHNILQS